MLYSVEPSIVAQEADAIWQAAQTDPTVHAQVQDAFTARWDAVDDVQLLRALQPHLPQLPDTAAQQIYEEVEANERRFAAPTLRFEEYGEGVATEDDEVAAVCGGLVLVSAEHATDPFRLATGVREGADHGTAGLAATLAQHGLADAYILTGRQTNNANVGQGHPLKDRLATQFYTQGTPRPGFMAVHGMRPGHVPGVLDESEIHGIIGLGRHEPRPRTLEVAERLIQATYDEFGLRVAVGNYRPHLIYKNDPTWQAGGLIRDKANELRYGDDGLPKTSRLAALGTGTTTNFIMESTADLPDFANFPAFQLEISRSLRLTPQDKYNRDPAKMRWGVYMGYLLASKAAELLQSPTA